MLLIPCNLPTCFKLTYHKFAVCVTCTLLHASNLFTVSLQPPIKCVCVQSAVLNMQPVHVPSHVHICVDLFANYIFHICIHSNHQGRVWWDPLLLLEAQPLCNPSNNHKRLGGRFHGFPISVIDQLCYSLKSFSIIQLAHCCRSFHTETESWRNEIYSIWLDSFPHGVSIRR